MRGSSIPSLFWGRMHSALPFPSASHSRLCREEASRLMVLLSVIIEVESLQGCESVMRSDDSDMLSEGGVDSVVGRIP